MPVRPMKLTMSAFGSFGAVETIDFSGQKNGIFLITGDTGSGKTTIFDAISYALFGETSGEMRDGSMMRSQYAREDAETYVELIFEERRKTYRVRRSPAYGRISRRKDKNGLYKEVSVPAKASLTMPDGSLFPGSIREINGKIQEIIGVDREQYGQIAMIAQGEYMKLLHASSRERKQIFSKIFGTGIYARIQLRLKDEFNRLYGTLEDTRKLEAHEREKVMISPESCFYEAWKNLEGYQETKKQEMLEILEHILQETKEKEEQLKKQREQVQKDAARVDAQLMQAKEVNQNFEQKAFWEKRLETLQNQSEEIRQLKMRQENAKKAETVLPAQQAYLEALAKSRAAGEHVSRMKKHLEEEKVRFRTAKITVLQAYKKACADAEAAQEESRECLRRLQEQFETADGQYNLRYRLFLEVQAGIMASDLEEGMMCPVCGSTHHPKKAPLPEEKVSQLWVEQAKKERDMLEKKRSEAAENCIRAKEKCRMQIEAYQEQKKRWSDPDMERMIDDKSKIADAKKNGERQLEQLAESVRTMEGMLQAEIKNAGEREKEAEKRKEDYTRIRKEAGFDSEDAYRACRVNTNVVASWEKKIKEYEQAVMQAKTSQETYDGLTRGKQPVDTASWREEAGELERRQKELHKEEVAAAARYQGNRQILKNLRELKNRQEELEGQYHIILQLYQTANGKLSGTAGMDFQTFVQRRYFKQMIQAANRRLKYMTDGQFLLQCRDLEALGKQGEVGLDLDVYSVVTGKTRDIKTLSGGESFMAALSMALGMADIIRSAAGNVRMDTMFLDEGFGSLDDDARLRAIRILQELAGENRSIGIISHVTELKEQIDRKLVVKKEENGSHVAWE